MFCAQNSERLHRFNPRHSRGVPPTINPSVLHEPLVAVSILSQATMVVIHLRRAAASRPLARRRNKAAPPFRGTHRENLAE
ncbi:hypothetical protein BLAT2472_10794 [Burkholderia latens]